MSQESTTPDLVELARRVLDAANRLDFDVFSVDRASGRPVGSTGRLEYRLATAAVWEEGLIVRITAYTDIDEGRAAAERLAQERG
jgi:hypothetical protein